MNLTKIVLLTFLYAATPQLQSQVTTKALEMAPEITISGELLQYTGPINQAGVDKVITQIRTGKFRTLRIDSNGGDIMAAMKFGEAIYDLTMNVVVTNKCASSCANYIFSAARHRTIEAGAYVMWHGDARQKSFLAELARLEEKALRVGVSEMTDAEQSRLDHRKETIQTQDAFYAKLGINGRIARFGHELSPPISQWILSTDEMAKFGIVDVDAPAGYATQAYCDGLKARGAIKSGVHCIPS